MSITILLHKITWPRKGGIPKRKRFIGTFVIPTFSKHRTFTDVLRADAGDWIPDKLFDAWELFRPGPSWDTDACHRRKFLVSWDSFAQPGNYLMTKHADHWGTNDTVEDNVLQYFTPSKKIWRECAE